MRELTLNEVHDVNGGVAQIAVCAVFGGLANGFGSWLSGGSFGGGFASGFIGGALIGSGVGLMAGASVVGGATLTGAGVIVGGVGSAASGG